VSAYARSKGVWTPVPLALILGLETTLQRAPVKQRKALARRWPLRNLLNCALVAVH